MSAYAPIEVGCEAYIVRDNQLLLGLRGKSAYGAGTWGLPGGRVEFQERAVDTIVREVKEELAITIQLTDAQLLAVTDDPQPDHDAHHLHLTFRVDIGHQAPQLAEPEACDEWRWFALDALPPNLFPPHTKILATIASDRVYQTNRA